MGSFLLSLLMSVAFSGGVWAAADKIPETKTDDPYLLMDLLGLTFDQIKKESVEEVTYRQMVEKSINGVLTSLDPHSGFLNQE